MSDGSSKGLRQEWSILIQSFIEEDSAQPMEVRSQNEELSHEEIKLYSRQLSQRRKFLNKQIEDIKLAIDVKNLTVENLILVKSDTSEILAEIEQLNQKGEAVSQELMKLDQKARSLRIAEALFLTESQSA